MLTQPIQNIGQPPHFSNAAQQPRASNGRFQSYPKSADELKAELLKCIVTASEVIPKPPACFYMKNTIVGTLGNFSMFLGKAKQGKTFAITLAIAAAENYVPHRNSLSMAPPSGKEKILLFDTEQSRFHLQKVVKRVAKLAKIEEPENLTTYGLRQFSPNERLELIEYKISNTPNLGIVVIDGIRDLVNSINDEEQATMIAGKLLKWSQELEIHIIVVLHMNKNDNNARGHVGTELQNKAESVFTVARSNDDRNTVIIEATSTRGKEPEPVAFMIDEFGNPIMIEDWSKEAAKAAQKPAKTEPWEVPLETHYEILRPMFKRKKEFTSREFLEMLSMELKRYLSVQGVSRERVGEWRAHLVHKGVILESGTAGTRAVRIRLHDAKSIVN